MDNNKFYLLKSAHLIALPRASSYCVALKQPVRITIIEIYKETCNKLPPSDLSPQSLRQCQQHSKKQNTLTPVG